MATVPMTRELMLFGVEEDVLRRQLADILDSAVPQAALSCCEGEGRLTLTAEDSAVLEAAEATVRERLGVCVYAADGESLEQQVVALLTRYGKTVATAESCTGGMISSRLTGVPGSSRVFGTGVVSYSADCKQGMLGVSPETLKLEGTVCAAVAQQMAQGVRESAGAHIGVAVTGEAGPQAAEAVPVGTVFIALADARRTWVCELHLQGDRNAIRRQAASHVLYLLYRYLEAYPTVMAGGISNREAKRTIPRTQGEAHPRLRTRLLPWRGDSLRVLLIKCIAWLVVLALLVGGGMLGYRYLLAPNSNRQLQNELGELYWNTDLTEDVGEEGNYPSWLMAQFRGLYQINPHVAGWIQVSDTAVDYPVMFYTDGYYKNHNFNDQYSVYGQPYFAEDTLLRPKADYHAITVYGKNTGDGQMFSDLLGYRRVAFLQEHPLIEMNTVVESARWEIFAVLVVDERCPEECDYSRTDFADEAEFSAHIAMLQERSLFHSNLEVTAADELLLLSVNAEDVYRYSAARLVIAARRTADTDSQAVYRVNNRAKMPAVLSGGSRTTARVTTRTTTVTTTSPGSTAASTTVPVTETTATATSTTATTVTTTATTASVTTSATEGVMATTTATAVPDETTTTTGEPPEEPSAEEEQRKETEQETYDYTGD
ncbi:MAG: nicotinamide-nucleotide amidohydrolase family protein [Clostridia bacterium]|nr:nicotinamide-nucleotide amidohydrolase family protein [Clostridia bacterium]